MSSDNHYFDEGSRLAAETRAARRAYEALDRAAGAYTVDREAAQARIRAAAAAERAYWEGR